MAIASKKKAVAQQRNANLSYSNSTNGGQGAKAPQTLLESAYRTTTNGFNIQSNQ